MKYAIAALMLAFSAGAGANDGIGTVAAGGIVFGRTDAIAMKKEVLNVGHDWITVDYEFLNESGADVEETIIFPLPAYPAGRLVVDTYFGQPAGFTVTVDGKPVRTRTEVRALLNDIDVTAQLKHVGLSDAQIAYGAVFDDQAKVAPLSAQQIRQLEKLNLFGARNRGEASPQWDVQINYVWQQTFPSNRIVRVHHAYRPFTGTGPGEWAMNSDVKKDYCMDATFLAGWQRLAKNAKREFDPVPAVTVAYILKTGNTWKNGIEDFTLNIVKSRPDELVSLCFPGTFKKTDAKTLQVKLRNFRPTRDLAVYFGNVGVGTANPGELPRLNR